MLKIRYVFAVLGMLLYPGAASAQVSIGIGLPHVSIGINLPVFPQLVVVPGYPVYYAPRLEANYFFYDGMYWVYQDDNWYSSSWYNGPWWLVGPEVVPVFILRIPVRYYRRPPVYFYGWRSDAPPRWSNHWGHDWEQRRSGWDRWDRHAAPPPAPLPVYQRQYSKDRYPRQVEQQQELHKQKYRYQPRDPVVRQRYQEQAVPKAPAQRGQPQREKPGAPEEKGSRPRDIQRSAPRPQESPAAPRAQPPQRGDRDVQRPTPASPQPRRPEVQDRRQAPQPQLDERERQTPRLQGREEKQQDRDAAREPKRRQGQEQERGRERNEQY
jgi:hypothetical protein